jgi:phospholipid/cholesterol/gamma-HCH transport system permease protein
MKLGEFFWRIVDALEAFLLHFTEVFRLVGRILSRLPLIPRNVSLSIWQMFAIGITSVPLVTVIAIFAGAVTTTQVVYEFSGFVPLRYLGLAVCKSMITEIVPVITALVISGRISTAIAAEIGSMKNTEQLDAMTILDLDPIRYLIVPKTVACIIMLPVLVIWAMALAFGGAIITVVLSVHMTLFSFLNGLRMYFHMSDLLVGVFKTSVFGAIIAIVGSYFGYQAKGGAEGVGIATTKAVMLSSVLILIFDFIIAFLVLR